MKIAKKFTPQEMFLDNEINTGIVAETSIYYERTISKQQQQPLSYLMLDDSDNLSFWKSIGINKNISADEDRLHLIKSGIPKSTLNKLLQTMDISLEDMADILHTTDRTLRRYTDATILNTEQSERILELAKLYSYGKLVFDSLPTFKSWMNIPIVALGNKAPMQFLDTSLGINMVTQVLGRIEHGIYS
jgi:putative toxin-antitoxin system antitoxin component (TIGR02293 family)